MSDASDPPPGAEETRDASGEAHFDFILIHSRGSCRRACVRARVGIRRTTTCFSFNRAFAIVRVESRDGASVRPSVREFEIVFSSDRPVVGTLGEPFVRVIRSFVRLDDHYARWRNARERVTRGVMINR